MAVNVGILGFAHGHVESYIGQWKEHPEMGVTVVAGWDHDADRLQAAVERHGIKGYAKAAELLAQQDIQAVIIPVETSLHADLVELAAAAGKAIVVQKPLALTVEQGKRIIAAVNKYKVPFTLAWQMRVDEQNSIMRDMVHQEKLGKVLHFRRRHCLTTHNGDWFAKAWHNAPEYNRDVWSDDSSHPIDWINHVFGAPESITAEIVTPIRPDIPNNNGVALFRYKDGPIVEVSCSFTCWAATTDTEIICENGTIVHSYGDAPSGSIKRPEGEHGFKWYSIDTKEWEYSNSITPDAHWTRIANLAKPLADFLNGKASPICTAEDGLVSLRMVLACLVSSKEGRRVMWDDPAIDQFV